MKAIKEFKVTLSICPITEEHDAFWDEEDDEAALCLRETHKCDLNMLESVLQDMAKRIFNNIRASHLSDRVCEHQTNA